MRIRRLPKLLRLLFCLAAFQTVAPAFAAVADAWRMDSRVPVAHIESEGGAGCVFVHSDNCALCNFLSTGTGDVPAARLFPIAHVNCALPVANANELNASRQLPPVGQRAPPVA